MTTQTISSVSSTIGQFNLQSRLFNNVTVDLPEDKRHERMNENTNHIAWLTGHIVSTRYMLLNLLGVQASEPFPNLFEQGKGIQEGEYPTQAELTAGWDSLSEQLSSRLNELTDAELDAESPIKIPIGPTMRDTLAFFAHHEAYTIGQLGIYRRFFGLEAMKYS